MSEAKPTEESHEIGAAEARQMVDGSVMPELTTDEKTARIRELITANFGGQSPDVFIMHTGGIAENPRGPMGYRSTSYSDVSEHGIATGGRTRIIAGAEIAKALPNLKIITNSINRFDPEVPSMAVVNKEELVRRGIDPDRITREEDSFSTVTQLTEMIRLAVANNWAKIASLTNEYHHPRVQAMYERLDSIIDDAQFQKTLAKFKKQGTKVVFIDAEPVMRLIDPHFVTYLNEVAKTPQFKHTLETEAKGLADLKAGHYRVVLKPEAPRVKDGEA